MRAGRAAVAADGQVAQQRHQQHDQPGQRRDHQEGILAQPGDDQRKTERRPQDIGEEQSAARPRVGFAVRVAAVRAGGLFDQAGIERQRAGAIGRHHAAGGVGLVRRHRDAEAAEGEDREPVLANRRLVEQVRIESPGAQHRDDDVTVEVLGRPVDAAHGRRGQRTVAPGGAPASTSSRNRSAPPLPADRIIPSETPKRILRGARLATNTTLRPISASGSP